MKKLSCLISILLMCLVEFHNIHLIDARRHHHQQRNNRGIHASYQPWESDGNGDGGGGSLSPWELNLMAEILTEFGISKCPAIDTKGFNDFREYISEPISRARETRVINDQFTQVYDSLTYCLGSESGIDWQGSSESEEEGADGTVTDQEPEEGYQYTMDKEKEDDESIIYYTTAGTESVDFGVSTPSTIAPESVGSRRRRSNDDAETLEGKEVSLDASTINDEVMSTEPSGSDALEVFATTDSEEIGLLKKAIQLGQEIFRKVEDLFTWIGPERRGAKQFVNQLGMDPSSMSTEETVSEQSEEEDAMNPSYRYEIVSRELLRTNVESTKDHFSDVFQRSASIAFEKCPALQQHRSFIEDSLYKIVTLIYEDLDGAAESDEVLNVDKELESKLRDCTNPDK